MADVAELANVLKAREAKDYWRSVGDRYFMRRYERARPGDLVARGREVPGPAAGCFRGRAYRRTATEHYRRAQ